mmetsp:Transcript_10487/g.23829  ORF Transcript_10487/g.23829 Transcript_10487/m.23829 type:complete len:465 (-) Transcript_10487:33-1427(-)
MDTSRTTIPQFGDGIQEPFFAVKVGWLHCFCTCATPSIVRDEAILDPRIHRPDVEDKEEEDLILDPHDDQAYEEMAANRRMIRKPSQTAMSFSQSLSPDAFKMPLLRESESPYAGARSRKLTSLEEEMDQQAERSTDAGTGGSIIRENVESAESPMGKTLTIEEVEEVRLFREAVASGRYVEANRQVQRLKAACLEPSTMLDPTDLERTRRIADMYGKSLGMLKSRVKDLETNEQDRELKVEWGTELKDDVLRLVYGVEEPDLDVVSALAAMAERDMQGAFNRGLVKAEALGDQTMHDTFWRAFTFSKTTKVKGDNVTICSMLDALDEVPMAVLWGSYYTPPEEAAKFLGIDIPPCEQDHTRAEDSFTAFMLTPLKRNGNRCHGFHMKVTSETKLPKVMTAVLSVMPHFVRLRYGRGKVKQTVLDFRQFVANSKELNRRLSQSPRADFYRQLRQRLNEDSSTAG